MQLTQIFDLDIQISAPFAPVGSLVSGQNWNWVKKGKLDTTKHSETAHTHLVYTGAELLV